MHFFPVAAVTNDHRFSGFNSTNLFSYGFGDQKPKVRFSGLKSKCRQSWFLLEAPRQIAFLTSCSFWRLPTSFAHSPFLYPQSQRCTLLPSLYCLLPLWSNSFCFPHLGYLRLYLSPIWIIQNNLISRFLI